MNNYYLYKFNYTEEEKIISCTVIFCDRTDINEDNIRDEIRRFYEINYQTDKILVLGGAYLRDRLLDVFISKQDSTFKGIPKRNDTALSDSIYIITFNKHGVLKCENGKIVPTGFLDNYLNEGLQNIFISRGGLIVSPGAHHFVFPSGKHCDKFLRTGNILLVSSEIYFIAFALLRHFNEKQHTQIYCDTSSINSIAFALIELKNRFLLKKHKRHLPIESFSSYEGLYKNPITYSTNALLLISASTSSNIISYIKKNHSLITRENIVVLFFLGEHDRYVEIKEKVVCNLTYSDENINGIPFYKTFKEDNCELCQKGSYPVKISGDVFSLENPKVNSLIISTTDAEKYLSNFVRQFKSINKAESILKTNFKENSELKYEIYIDYEKLLEGVRQDNRCKDYKIKLNAYIDQYVPSNSRYILTLNDQASQSLGKYIYDRISTNYVESNLPQLLTQDNLQEINKEYNGSILVVGCCISNGKNLLYISRALRQFSNLRIKYFIGISQTRTKKHLNFLKSNLKQGAYGPETNSYIEVESIFCNNDSKNTSWIREIDFLQIFIDWLRDGRCNRTTLDFLEKRKNLLNESSGIQKKGLSEDLFYPRVTTDPYEALGLRKNFAFYNFDYGNHISQSDVYFTISNVINSLRNSEKGDRNLRQSIFVRNLIDPGNFNRFNDGVIQASILRAANADELSFRLDQNLSQEMTNILETIINYYNDQQGEALLEFLYAIATKKMSLKTPHLEFVLTKLDNCHEDIIKCFQLYIRENILQEPQI